MDSRRLSYFIAVAERLNFSRAAEAMHVAQPAISQQIKSLEEELGMPLFERLGKRVLLTEAGEALLPHARQILAALEAAQNEVRELGTLAKGKASLGAPPSIAAHMLPPKLTAFEQRYPGLEVTLREAGTETLLKLVNRGELDIAIVSTDVLPNSLDSESFLTEPYLLAVSPAHPLCKRKSVRLTELAEEPFILFPDGYKLREVTREACRRAGFEPKVALDGGSLQSALQFVAAGLGVALIPQLAVQHAPNVCGLPISDQNLTRTMGLIWRKGQYLSPAARALREHLLSRR